MGEAVVWLFIVAGGAIAAWLVWAVVRQARTGHGHADGAEVPWFIPGSGGHGGDGGQVPPMVPEGKKLPRIP